MRRFASFLAVLAIVATPVSAAARDISAFPGAAGRIVYVDDGLDDAPVIASMAADGSDVKQLTTSTQSPYGDYDPAWSPGGTLIVFTRLNGSQRGDVWRMKADGSAQTKMTDFNADQGYASWSADGSRIVFASTRDDIGKPPADWEIYSINYLGGDLHKLTNNTATDLDPVWSPDNDRIMFSSARRGYYEIFTMATNGTGVVRETDGLTEEADHEFPDWDPDGVHATFSRNAASGAASLNVMLLDTATRVVTPLVAAANSKNYSSAFSPAQAPGEVVFQTDRLGTDDIAVIDKGGGPVDVLTEAHSGNQMAPDWQPIPAFPLVDARFSTFKLDIEWAFAEGITVGCTPERYCPDDSITRAEIATFLVRALDLPPTTTDYFTDDETSIHEGNINRLRAAGLTSGCGATTFCPTAKLPRDEMAAFLARAFHLPATTTDYFTDDGSSIHEQSINRIAEAGVTTGCTPTTYCPGVSVTRGQMAAFLHRAME